MTPKDLEDRIKELEAENARLRENERIRELENECKELRERLNRAKDPTPRKRPGFGFIMDLARSACMRVTRHYLDGKMKGYILTFGSYKRFFKKLKNIWELLTRDSLNIFEDIFFPDCPQPPELPECPKCQSTKPDCPVCEGKPKRPKSSCKHCWAKIQWKMKRSTDEDGENFFSFGRPHNPDGSLHTCPESRENYFRQKHFPKNRSPLQGLREVLDLSDSLPGVMLIE